MYENTLTIGLYEIYTDMFLLPLEYYLNAYQRNIMKFVILIEHHRFFKFRYVQFCWSYPNGITSQNISLFQVTFCSGLFRIWESPHTCF